METAIPNQSLGLFRRFAMPPSPTAIDGRRVLVQLREDADPETGGRYSVKRWRVTKRGPDGNVEAIELRSDNPDFKPIALTQLEDVRALAEFLEVVA